jgi:hypothetical protein
MKGDLKSLQLRRVVAGSASTFDFCAKFIDLFKPRKPTRRMPKLCSRCPECSRSFHRKQPLTAGIDEQTATKKRVCKRCLRHWRPNRKKASTDERQ